MQPAISGLVDFPVSFCGVPVIKGIGDLPRELLIAADPNDNLPIGFHAPKHCTCHFSLQSQAVQMIAAQQHLCTLCCCVCLPIMTSCLLHAWAEWSRHCRHSTAQHSTAQHSTAQHSTSQHSTAQHSMAMRLLSTITGVKVLRVTTHLWQTFLRLYDTCFGRHHNLGSC